MVATSMVNAGAGPRDRRIQVLVNRREQHLISERARQAGMDVGPYLRSLALGNLEAEPGEAETRELVQEALRRMTGRLEQTVEQVQEALARIEAVERSGQ